MTLLLALALCVYRQGGALPDPVCTPGALNSAVTQKTIRQTICKRGWTETVRPPLSVTEPEKRKSVHAYGGTRLSPYEYDHLVPLELGGAPNDPRNLWPEPHQVTGDYGSYTKDGVENGLRIAVCAGRLTLAKARRMIRADWTRGLPWAVRTREHPGAYPPPL